jgi:hypothetical protein
VHDVSYFERHVLFLVLEVILEIITGNKKEEIYPICHVNDMVQKSRSLWVARYMHPFYRL